MNNSLELTVLLLSQLKNYIRGLHISNHDCYRPQNGASEHTAPGDVFKIGSYSFTVIDLPGHTPGLQALYEPEHQLLFCGDHILGDITPNITFWDFAVGDSLGTYFKSLELVETLPIRYLFSAHRSLVEDVSKRITELLFTIGTTGGERLSASLWTVNSAQGNTKFTLGYSREGLV